MTIKVSIIGVAWPPETFIERKLLGLAEAGVPITVWVTEVGCVNKLKHANLQIKKIPSKRKGKMLFIFSVCLLTLKNLMIRPIGFMTHFKQIKQSHLSYRHKVKYWIQTLPFLGNKKDIFHFEWNSTAMEYAEAFSLIGFAFTVSCRGSFVNIAPHDPRRPDLRKKLQISLEKATAVHGVSCAILEEARQWGLDPKKASVITPAVDNNFFYAKSENIQDHSTIQLITIGTLLWRKGYEYLLSTLKILKDQNLNIHLHIVGSGDKGQWQRIRFTVTDLGLENLVTLHGKKKPSEIRTLLQQSDIYVLASLSEGIANAMLEAMACALPVVGTSVGGASEVISEGVEGYLVPLRDPNAMAEKIMKLSREPNLREKMGKAGRIKVEKQFSLSGQIQSFIRFYEKAVQGACSVK